VSGCTCPTPVTVTDTVSSALQLMQLGGDVGVVGAAQANVEKGAGATGFTPLGVACYHGKVAVARVLVEVGVLRSAPSCHSFKAVKCID
jgi:hypothetical protein